MEWVTDCCHCYVKKCRHIAQDFDIQQRTAFLLDSYRIETSQPRAYYVILQLCRILFEILLSSCCRKMRLKLIACCRIVRFNSISKLSSSLKMFWLKLGLPMILLLIMLAVHMSGGTSTVRRKHSTAAQVVNGHVIL